MNIVNKVFLFWNIGKNLYERENSCSNIVQKYSEYCSYYYGNSIQFTRENMHFMKRFYMNYPIYHSKFNDLSWEHIQLFLQIPDRQERNFYFYISLFINCNYTETIDLIQNHYYIRI